MTHALRAAPLATLALFVALAGCDAAGPEAAAADASATTQYDIAFPLLVCGESIDFAGTRLEVYRFGSNPAGRVHSVYKWTDSLVGTAADGTTYTYRYTDNYVFNLDDLDGAPTTFTWPFTEFARSSPGGVVLRIRSLTHLTVNANGEITVDNSDFVVDENC